MNLDTMSAEEIASAPVAELALALLASGCDSNFVMRDSLATRFYGGYSTAPGWGTGSSKPRAIGLSTATPAGLALAEAWHYLLVQQLLCEDLERAITLPGIFRLTRRGRAVMQHGLAYLRELQRAELGL